MRTGMDAVPLVGAAGAVTPALGNRVPQQGNATMAAADATQTARVDLARASDLWKFIGKGS